MTQLLNVSADFKIPSVVWHDTWKCYFFPGCFTSRKLRSRLCCVESQKKVLKNANSSAASRKILPHPGAPRQRGLLEFPAVSLSYFCPALPNAHRLFDGCDSCFCACKWKKCSWMLVMGKSWYCITVFDYHPLCWTEWRRFAQHMWSCFWKPLQLKFTNVPPTATRNKSTHAGSEAGNGDVPLGCCGEDKSRNGE